MVIEHEVSAGIYYLGVWTRDWLHCDNTQIRGLQLWRDWQGKNVAWGCDWGKLEDKGFLLLFWNPRLGLAIIFLRIPGNFKKFPENLENLHEISSKIHGN